MANEEVTTSLNIDITQFKSALTEANRYIRMANSEFDKATAGTEKWSGSADGLRAKITQLNKTLDAQEAAAAALRLEYDRVAAEQGENSKGAQELAIKLNKQEAACKKTAAQIKKYEGDLEDVESGSRETQKETGEMSAAFDKAAKAAGGLAKGLAKIAGKTIVNSIKGIAAASGALVTAFLATGEASKEHITEMSKLEAAYKSAGHTTETAAKAYEELYSVIGETDQAVEAAQQIALLADSEEEAARWAEQGAAVVGKFGDALQPETFFQAANETLKLNEATGAYVQMLEGTGQSVDAFNKGLAKCKTEAEKQAYMLEYTQKALGSAGEEYRKANAAVIENNKANAKLQESLAGVGEAALPVMTALKLIGASILGDLLPHIEKLGGSFTKALTGSKSAAQDMGNAVGAILQNLGQKIVDALPTIVTVGTSIITSLVNGLVKAVPALAEGVTQIVQYFIKAAPQLLSAGASMISSLVDAIRTNLPQLLKAGGDMLYKLLDGVVSNLPAMAQGAMDAIGDFVNGIQTYLPVILKKGSELLGKLGDGIRKGLPDLVDQALDILMNFATTLYDNAPTLIDTGFDLLSDLVEGIMDALPKLIKKGPEIISKFANIINKNFPKILKKGVELIGQIIKGILKAIPTLIKNAPKILEAIVDVWEAFNWVNLGKNAIKLLKDGVLKMVSSVKSAGKSVMDSITNVIKELPGKLLSFGKNSVTKMASGIKSMASSAVAAGSGVFNGIVNIIKALPSKLLSFGKNAVSSLGTAIGNGLATVKSKATSIFNGAVNAIKNLPSKLLSFGKNAVSNLGTAISNGLGTVKSKATGIFNAVVNNIKDLPSKLLSVGKNLVEGLWNGISNKTGWIINKIKSFGESVLGGIKKFFGIKSPSKVMRDEVGKWLPAGLAEGVTRNTKTATKAMANMAKSALSAANAEMSGVTLKTPGTTGAGKTGPGGVKSGATVVFNQYNNSPKSLSRREIYRQTKNVLRFATGNA